jgi:hypothetical protein
MKDSKSIVSFELEADRGNFDIGIRSIVMMDDIHIQTANKRIASAYKLAQVSSKKSLRAGDGLLIWP